MSLLPKVCYIWNHPIETGYIHCSYIDWRTSLSLYESPKAMTTDEVFILNSRSFLRSCAGSNPNSDVDGRICRLLRSTGPEHYDILEPAERCMKIVSASRMYVSCIFCSASLTPDHAYFHCNQLWSTVLFCTSKMPDRLVALFRCDKLYVQMKPRHWMLLTWQRTNDVTYLFLQETIQGSERRGWSNDQDDWYPVQLDRFERDTLASYAPW